MLKKKTFTLHVTYNQALVHDFINLKVYKMKQSIFSLCKWNKEVVTIIPTFILVAIYYDSHGSHRLLYLTIIYYDFRKNAEKLNHTLSRTHSQNNNTISRKFSYLCNPYPVESLVSNIWCQIIRYFLYEYQFYPGKWKTRHYVFLLCIYYKKYLYVILLEEKCIRPLK